VSKATRLNVSGCYRTPSAECCVLSFLIQLLTQLDIKEIVVLGDFNLNWLQPVSDDLKAYCDSKLVSDC